MWKEGGDGMKCEKKVVGLLDDGGVLQVKLQQIIWTYSEVTRNLQEDDEDWLVSHDNMSWRCEELKTEQEKKVEEEEEGKGVDEKWHLTSEIVRREE